jgi:hypothetical protein
MWLGLTVAFELIFFHHAMGHPWSRLLHDYNVFAGRVWVTLLMWLTVARYVFYRMQGIYFRADFLDVQVFIFIGIQLCPET